MNPSRVFSGLSPRAFRRAVNWFPAIRRTGVRVTDISDDWMHWELTLRRRLGNMNYVGTMFGGALYASADPHYMLAFLHILGRDYIVWDKAATIRFKRPGRTTLHGEIHIEPSQVAKIRSALETETSVDQTFAFRWLDPDGEVVVEVDKVLYFRKKGSRSV